MAHKTPIKWTPEKVEELRRLFPMMTLNELGEHFGTSGSSLHAKAAKLGLYRRGKEDRPRKVWTPDEVEEFKRLWATTSATELAAKFGVDKAAVLSKASNLGLRKRREVFNPTPEQISWLRRNYPHVRNEVCCSILNIHPRVLSKLASRLALHKTPEFIHETAIYAGRRQHKLHPEVSQNLTNRQRQSTKQ